MQVVESLPDHLLGQDRRSEPRHQVSIEGVLIDSFNLSRKFDCTITELSETGARISCDGLLPDRVLLFESYNGNIFECEVHWRKGQHMGVLFLETRENEKRRALIAECSVEGVQEIPGIRRFLYCLTGSVAITNDIMPIMRAFLKRPVVFGVNMTRVAIYQMLNHLIVKDDPSAKRSNTLEDLHLTILRLPLLQRKALVLSFTMGFSMAEVASILSVKEQQAEDLVADAFSLLNDYESEKRVTPQLERVCA